jgi:hypothetical protein
MVLSERGAVIENWTGSYTGEVTSEVERFFGLSLPGLVEPESAAASGAPTQG